MRIGPLSPCGNLRKMELPERPWRNRSQWFDLAGYEVLNAHR
jgi:hypothetical protein